MRIQYIEMQTPAGIRSAYLALPDGAYDENWKSSSITILREDDSEQSVRRLIDEAGLQFIVDEQKSILGFPNPVDGLWHFDGGETLTDDEQFVQAFSCAALPGGAFSDGWRVMGDVHYLVGFGTGASLIHVLTACHPSNGLAAAICTVGGELPEKALAHATGSPVPACLLGSGPRAAAYYLRANEAKPLGNGRYACDHNAMQRVYLSDTAALDQAAGRIMWDEFFHVIRRTNTSPWGDVDRRIIPEECGFEWHTLDTRLGDNNGLAHSWIEHCPDWVRANPDKKVPLVLFSHGMSDNPLKAADMIKIHEVGQREGFVSVYTFSSNRYSWNLACDPEKEDDVAYYVALIDYLKHKYPIDSERVYVSGFSNGAGMAMIFALSHPDLVAAGFPVDSTFPYAAMRHFRPAQQAPYITPVLKPGQKAPAFSFPRNDPEKSMMPLRAALARQEDKRYTLPIMYFYGTRESEYPIRSGSNQELSYNFWKEFNGIDRAPTDDSLQTDAVGVPGQQVNELHPDPAHPAHSYQENIFFTGEGKDYYHFMLMRGKAHEVHPAERELGWAFVSRFRRLADGTLADSRDSEVRGC